MLGTQPGSRFGCTLEPAWWCFGAGLVLLWSRFGLLWSLFGLLWSLFGLLWSLFGLLFMNSHPEPNYAA